VTEERYLLKKPDKLISDHVNIYDRGEAKGGDKVNLVIEGGDMMKYLTYVVLHKEIFISINKYIKFF
jgi:hypothetical protein